jgi:hypothetical protein
MTYIEYLRYWLKQEILSLHRGAELRISDAVDIVTSFIAGELSEDQAEARISKYQSRWYEPIPGISIDEGMTNAEILAAIENNQQRPPLVIGDFSQVSPQTIVDTALALTVPASGRSSSSASDPSSSISADFFKDGGDFEAHALRLIRDYDGIDVLNRAAHQLVIRSLVALEWEYASISTTPDVLELLLRRALNDICTDKLHLRRFGVSLEIREGFSPTYRTSIAGAGIDPPLEHGVLTSLYKGLTQASYNTLRADNSEFKRPVNLTFIRMGKMYIDSPITLRSLFALPNSKYRAAVNVVSQPNAIDILVAHVADDPVMAIVGAVRQIVELEILQRYQTDNYTISGEPLNSCLTSLMRPYAVVQRDLAYCIQAYRLQSNTTETKKGPSDP